MKKILLGFLCGAVATVCITAFAAQMEVVENPYKVLVNGEEVKIEGYNINGSTYFKLRDVGGVTNLDVGFENDTITIATQKPPEGGGPQGAPVDAALNENYKNMSLEKLQEQLAQDVADGKITQAQANEILKNYTSGPRATPNSENTSAQ